MNDTILIEVTNNKAIKLLHQLEELNLIKVITKNTATVKTGLSKKYSGVITKSQGKELNSHIEKMRNEWNSI